MNEKLEQIQEFARMCNSELTAHDPELSQLSGCLFVGKNYASSRRLFLGLNPGLLPVEFETSSGVTIGESFCVDLMEQSWDSLASRHAYWKNFCLFIDSNPRLREWMEDATAAFCVPWRTKDSSELRRVDRLSKERLSDLAGKLFHQILDHHRSISVPGSVVLVVAGVESLRWIKSKPFLNFDLSSHTIERSTSKGTYQWCKIALDDITIYQVPHFSRANSQARLLDCANWLVGHLGVTAALESSLERRKEP